MQPQRVLQLSVVLFFFHLTSSDAVAAPGPFTDNIHIASHYPSLQEAIDTAGPQGMVIVDAPYLGLTEIVLPRRFRLVGMGHQGDAVLAFTEAVVSAVRIAPPVPGGGDAWVSIENLDIEGPYAPQLDPADDLQTDARGIDLSNASTVFLRNLTVRGFAVGIYGNESFSVHVENCNVSVNRVDNYHLDQVCTSWRIRGGLSSFSRRYGINIDLGNNNLIQGVRLESNPVAGIRTNTHSTHIMNNRFECNQVPPFCPTEALAILIDTGAEQTSLVDNYYSGAEVVDQSSTETTMRVDAGHTYALTTQDGEAALRVALGSPADVVFQIDEDGFVAAGPEEFAPATRWHVRDEITGSAENVANHVATIENTAPAAVTAKTTRGDLGSYTAQLAKNNADVLALSVNVTNPDTANNFVTFFGAGSPVGSIEGNGAGGVTFKSGSADFAERLELLRHDETLEPGDVVGVFGGRITRRTAGAEQVHVVSTAPLLLGNAPEIQDARPFAPVAFLGQVPVKVRGPVNAGDYLVASGAGDGTAVARKSGELNVPASQIVGRAWESSSEAGLKSVKAYVSPQAESSTLRRKAADSAREAESLAKQLATVQARLDALEARIESR